MNFGVPGEGWAEIWRRNYRELLSVPEAAEVCLWAGTNDAWKGRLLEDIISACQAVLDQCAAAGRFVYLATLPGKRGFGAPREPWTMNETIVTLNDTYRRLARERGLALVELAEIPPSLLVDGIHLAQEGNKVGRGALPRGDRGAPVRREPPAA